MEKEIESFLDSIKKGATITLATASEGHVTMRIISPVLYHQDVLFFTHCSTLKYKQLKTNPHCCIGSGMSFAEAKAEFLGDTLADQNKNLRTAYCEKFPDAFDEGAEFGGRDSEFILLRLTKLRGWAFAPRDNSTPTEAGPDAIPTHPFEINL